MDIEEYKALVIQMILTGDKEVLDKAAECILECSDDGLECGEFFDEELIAAGHVI